MQEIPKYVFDKEYSTQWRREVEFLEDKGIAYTYAKKHFKYPVIKYKYTKTPELFLALAEFYKQVYMEDLNKRITEASSELLPIEKGCIDIPASELSDAEKALITEQDLETLLED